MTDDVRADTRIAVSAASGRLGHAVLEALLEDRPAESLCAIVRDPSRMRIDAVETRVGDYADPGSMRGALAGVDTLVFISAPVAAGGDRLAMHRDVIAAAVEAGVRKVIYTSVVGNGNESGTAFAEFARINRETEAALMNAGCEWIVARSGLYLDLDLGHIRAAAEGDGVYRNNGGEGRCGYISIGEIAFALAKLAQSDRCNGEVLNLSGEPRRQDELVAAANEVFGFSVRYEPISFAANVARFSASPAIAARGEDVIRMLAGCFECIENGSFDVPSDFERAAGRPVRDLREQLRDLGR